VQQFEQRAYIELGKLQAGLRQVVGLQAGLAMGREISCGLMRAEVVSDRVLTRGG